VPALAVRVAVSAVVALAILAAGTAAVDRSVRREDPAAAPAASATGVTLTIAEFAFAPDPLTVSAGAGVTIANRDGSPHTVTSGTRAAPDGRFDVSVEAGASAPLPAPPAGTYTYFCAIHPGMKGTLEVRP
jgi:plastocyanin